MAFRNNFLKQFRTIFFSIVLLLFLFMVIRIIFWRYNHELFTNISFRNIFPIFFWGLKMDLSAIMWLNIPVFILFFISQYFTQKSNTFEYFIIALFIGINISGIAVNIIDIGYFSYIKHRSNADLIYVFGDSLSSLGSLLKNYWILFFLFLLLSAVLIFFAKRIFSIRQDLSDWRTIFISHCLTSGLLILFARGWQSRPLIPSSPLLQIDSRQLPLAQNSVNTFLYSMVRKKNQLLPKKYFTEGELNEIVKTHRYCCTTGSDRDTMLHKNVVICILESFSRFYLTPGDPHKARTPFFDSLIKKSIFFPNAFSNSLSSNQGIVAILAGLPALLDEPFYYSNYANTPISGIGNILKEKGYNTNFFMGASYDHYGFAKFCRMAGIDNYYCRSDFNDDRFYDGNWGIFDEPFLQYGAAVLGKKQQPFLAVFFNLSSHPPFAIPEKFRQQFSSFTQSPAQRSISYVDYSYQQFFETIKKSLWFKNSIFVFCADHYIEPDDGSGYTSVSCTTIPIFIYDPSYEKGIVDTTMISQVDIIPSLLSNLHYKGTYLGFGNNIFDPSVREHYVINRIGQINQIIMSDFVLGYDISNEKSKYLYQYVRDNRLKQNLIADPLYSDTLQKMEYLLKANIQSYNNALIRRSLE